MTPWRPCRVCGYPVDVARGVHRDCATMETIPAIVHDLNGQTFRLTPETRRALAALIVEDAAYIYQAGTDPLFYNVWLENELDEVGHLGVRKPLADWGTAQ